METYSIISHCECSHNSVFINTHSSDFLNHSTKIGELHFSRRVGKTFSL